MHEDKVKLTILAAGPALWDYFTGILDEATGVFSDGDWWSVRTILVLRKGRCRALGKLDDECELLNQAPGKHDSCESGHVRGFLLARDTYRPLQLEMGTADLQDCKEFDLFTYC